MIDILEKFSPHLKAVLTRALSKVLEEGGHMITPVHLFWALGTEEGCLGAELLKKSGVEPQMVHSLVGTPEAPRTNTPPPGTPFLSDDAKKAIEKAIVTANIHEHRTIGTEHLLFGILSLRPHAITELFTKQGVAIEAVETRVSQAFRASGTLKEVESAPKTDSGVCTHCGHVHEPVAEGEEKTALEFFSVELTSGEYVKKIDGLVGRAHEVRRLATILTRRMKNNPLLLGDPGVGKTAIVEGLAKQIKEGTAPDGLEGTRIFMLDMAALLAGTMYRGDFEARLTDVLEDLKEMKNVILFIDEIHTLVGAGASAGAMDAANIMKPALARGEIRVIGATTKEEYKKYFEEDGALSRRFAPIMVKEPSVEETRHILTGLKGAYEKHHGITFTNEAIQTVLDMTARYLPHKAFPDKAIDLLDETGSAYRGRATAILPEDVRVVASAVTGIPLQTLSAKEDEKLRTLAVRLSKRVIGQDDAIRAVTDAITRAKLGLTKEQKPLASFLFVGPSGVGKTELAKAVAAEVFEDEKALIRLDMSEYAESYSMSKLIGSPPGYVGFKETARLTDAVKSRPYAVILFDEMEKAHRDVHHLILQLLDEGTLTDAQGTPINFRNTVVIMTSNAGREQFTRGGMGFTKGTAKGDARSVLEDAFSTEFLNRIDRICLFTPLTRHHLMKITEKEIRKLAARLKARGIALTSRPEVLHFLAQSLNPTLGAREVCRVISEQIETPLAQAVLKGKKQRGRTYRITAGKQGRIKII